MRTYDQDLLLSFVDSSFNVSVGRLEVMLETRYRKYPLEFLSISYLIFDMSSDLFITSLFNLTFVPSGINSFLGVSSVSSSGLAFNQSSKSAVKTLLGASPSQFQAF